MVLVVGIGNDWRSDDAAGLEVARDLRAAGVRAVARGGEPSGLLDAWDGEPEVILVDAVRSGDRPGTVHRLDARAGRLPPALLRASTHHLSVADAVELGRCLGRLPERLELYGIEGERFEAGCGLTAPVQRAVNEVTNELKRRLEGQGARQRLHAGSPETLTPPSSSS
jgi:hydrogenase maturation protease